jgi:outer membrane protein assembly factor BamB
MSFNPATGLVYFTAVSSRYWYNDIRNVRPFERRPGVRNEGVTTSRGPEPRPRPTALNGTAQLLAWDPSANREVWRTASGGASATLSTGGDLLFRGSGGRFYAHDPASGEVLWSVDVGGENFATPVTYEAGGRQYVAVEVTNPARVVAFAVAE